MKTIFLFLTAFLTSNLLMSQLLPTGTITTDNKFRQGGLGLGMTTLPSFGSNKLLVNGNSSFQGKLGIGTVIPTVALDVVGAARFQSLVVNNTAPRIIMSDVNGNLFFKLATTLPNFTNGCLTPNALTKNDANGNLTCSSIIENGTRIDIGLGNYEYFGSNSLNISKSVRVGSSMFVGNNTYITSAPGALNDSMLYFLNERKSGQFGSMWRLGNTSLNGDDKNGFSIQDQNAQTHFYIQDESGKVGIGTNVIPISAGTVNVSDYKLFVKGGILTEEVRVSLATTWADYVFAKDYQLPTLNEVEKQIQEKGHLPNMPSAKEVKENGIALGEMAKMQQEKIEELTLYAIEQNKTNEKQSKEIAELKELVKKLINK